MRATIMIDSDTAGRGTDLARSQAGQVSLSPSPGPLVELLAPVVEPRDPNLLANFFATLPSSQPVALEFAAEPGRLRLLGRTPTEQTALALARALYAALPRAHLRPVAPEDDPLQHLPNGGGYRAAELSPREPEMYSLRTYTRPSLDCEADPLAVLVRSLQGQQPGERSLLRLTVQPAPAGWQRPYLAWQRDVDPTHSLRRRPIGAGLTGASFSGELFLLVMIVVGLGLAIIHLQRTQPVLFLAVQALPLSLQLVGGGLAIALLVLLVIGGSRLWQSLLGLAGRPRLLPNQALIDSKLGRPGCLLRLHLWCWGPDQTSADRQFETIVAALRQYERPDGNGLVARRCHIHPVTGRVVLQRRYLGLFGRAPVVSVDELASLWGPVGSLADAGDLTRAGAVRRRPPGFAPDGRPWLADGQMIGYSEQGGSSRPIAYPRALRQRVNAIFGSTGSGKSTLLATLIADIMRDPQQTLVVFDSHSRLVQRVLGAVPARRARDVIVIDLGDPTHGLGLNLLDVTTGRPPERIVADTISALARLWPETWGDRMEQMLRAALTRLVALNQQRPPDQQLTLFHVFDLLLQPTFDQALREQAPAPEADRLWNDYYASRSSRLREEMINPVLTKLFKLRDLPVARRLLGQPRSTIDLTRAVLEHKIILVDLAQGSVGEDLAGLIGALIMSYVDQAIISQARLAPGNLTRGTVIFDEFETMPAINYDRIIAQLRKYGFGFFFATQSPEALAQRNPVLLAQLRDNCQALFAFRTSVEAAEHLIGAFDGLITPTDLANLETGCCYVKLEERGLPAPAFWLRVQDRPSPNGALAAHITAISRQRYANPYELIDRLVAATQPSAADLSSPPAASLVPLQTGIVPPPAVPTPTPPLLAPAAKTAIAGALMANARLAAEATATRVLTVQAVPVSSEGSLEAIAARAEVAAVPKPTRRGRRGGGRSNASGNTIPDQERG